MPRWSKEDYESYKSRRSGIRASDQKPVEGVPLVSPVPRKTKGGNSPPISTKPTIRKRIKFTVYSIRPCDWDGFHVKELQDLLVHAGIMDSDDWSSLQGEVISEKVHSKEEERTLIEITTT